MKQAVTILMVLTLCGTVQGTDQNTEMAVVKTDAIHCVAMEFSGPYTLMSQNMQRFMQVFFTQGLTPTGPPLAIYRNAPGDVPDAELKWAIAFPVAEGAEAAEPLKKIEFPAVTGIRYLHVGPYGNLSRSYEKIHRFLQNQNLVMQFPTLERYLDNPMEVAADELRTEIIVPVLPADTQ